jgi:hypothetical protein
MEIDILGGGLESGNKKRTIFLLPLFRRLKMTRKTIPIQRYIEAAQVFHWATKEHFILWFTGKLNRHRRTESTLHRLVQKDRLRCVRFGKRLVYTVPRRTKGKSPTLAKEKIVYEAGKSEKAMNGRNKIVHGLACTEALVRFFRSRSGGEIIPERYFYKLGAVPEWGIKYPNKTMLLFEFCTESNFDFSNMMKGKINAYKMHLEKIEVKFDSKGIVLFVIDVPRERVERFVGSLKRDDGSVADGDPSALYEGDRFPLDPFFFTDYETFLKVPFGDQMKASIYIWGTDGKKYPLRKND